MEAPGLALMEAQVVVGVGVEVVVEVQVGQRSWGP